MTKKNLTSLFLIVRSFVFSSSSFVYFVYLVPDVLPHVFPVFLHLLVFDPSFLLSLFDGLLSELLLLQILLFVAFVGISAN